MSAWTPSQIARADQNIAGVRHQLAQLVDKVGDDHDLEAISGLAEALYEDLAAEGLAVYLAVAVHRIGELTR